MVISLAVVLLTLLSKQKVWKTIPLFILGGVFAKIGFDNLSYKTWGTFGFEYLTLGIPFSAVMIGLYIIPEIIKFRNLDVNLLYNELTSKYTEEEIKDIIVNMKIEQGIPAIGNQLEDTIPVDEE